MHVEEAGNPDGPALLMVHGFLSSNAQWDLNRQALGERYRLVMVELVGHGHSVAPHEADGYTAEAHCDEFERIRQDHGIETWWVCGQSLGGAITIHYALAHPERLRGLIFTNSRAAFGIKRTGVSQDPATDRPKIGSTRDLPIHPMNATRLDEQIKARMVAAADAMPLHAVEQFLSRRHTWKSTHRMAELAMPVLLVNGRWEKSFQPFVEQAEESIGDLQVVTLEGGHAINAERPEEFNAAVIDFITQRSPHRAEQTG